MVRMVGGDHDSGKMAETGTAIRSPLAVSRRSRESPPDALGLLFPPATKSGAAGRFVEPARPSHRHFNSAVTAWRGQLARN